ncbi:MAG TPA: nicotinate phosphoribosyltransferase [Kiloniellales bacterium]|nr:nicotinate phosphoribosyltransferase [Kiloniellales bacterium]
MDEHSGISAKQTEDPLSAGAPRADEARRRDDGDSPLLTDLYQLNMMQAYLDRGMTETASFEFFIRKLPARRGFLLTAGLEPALDFLEGLHCTADEIEWLRGTGRFAADFLDYLATLRFEGDVAAMPEGTVFFPDEPILRVTAPLPIAQLVETRLINLLHFQTLIASKAARLVLAAPGRTLVDFGLRRAHGAEAGLLAARAAYIAGFAGSATMLANRRFGVPAYGTMAHSFIQAHDVESVAFKDFARSRPDDLVLLIDTYDTEAGARKVVELAPKLAEDGIAVRGVRLDSGDLADHARKVRRILDDGGLAEVRIFASGGLDEDKLQAFVAEGAPIDGYGIGTALTVSDDAPALDCAYKLQVYAGIARRKRSEGKATWPGRKQVFRHSDADGRIAGDVLTLEDDRQAGEPLLEPVIEAGRRLAPPPSLEAVRERAAAQLARLPATLARLEPQAYPVEVSGPLRALAEECDRRGT